jgi:hypothetical protein
MKRKATSTNNRKKTKNDPLVSELKHALLERSHTQQSVWESNSRNTMEFNDSNRISCVKIHKLHQYADNIIGLDSKTIGVVNRKLYFTLRQYSTNDLTFTETGLVASEINHPQRFGKDYIVFREGISVKIYNIAKKLDVCSYNASRQSIITVLNDQYIMFNKANEFYFATLHKNSIKIVHSISYDFSGDYFSYCLTNDGRICIYNSDGSLDVIGLDSIVNIRPKGDESYTDGTLLKMVSRDEVLISLPYERPARLELWNIGTKQLVKEIQCNTQLADMIVVDCMCRKHVYHHCYGCLQG